MLTIADLRPDTTIAATVEQLRQFVGDLPSAAHESEPFNAYRTKMLNMSRMLSNHFHWAAVETWVFDESYWRVMSEQQDRWTLNHELEWRPRLLEELRLGLVAQAQRWAGDETIALLDANVLLTERATDVLEDDWISILNNGFRIRLVIPLVVIHEIDRLKRTGNPTTSKAARASIKWLEQRIRTLETRHPVREDVTLEVFDSGHPPRTPDADLAILEGAEQLGVFAPGRVAFVTLDLGASLRAGGLGVKVRKISEADPPVKDKR